MGSSFALLVRCRVRTGEDRERREALLMTKQVREAFTFVRAVDGRAASADELTAD